MKGGDGKMPTFKRGRGGFLLKGKFGATTSLGKMARREVSEGAEWGKGKIGRKIGNRLLPVSTGIGLLEFSSSFFAFYFFGALLHFTPLDYCTQLISHIIISELSSLREFYLLLFCVGPLGDPPDSRYESFLAAR